MVGTWFSLLVAGAGHLIWHWGTGIGLILICLLCAYGTRMIAMIPLVGPPLSALLAPLRKDFIIAAALVALFLAGMYVGKQDADRQCVAKTVVIEKVVTKAVNKAKQPSKVDDPFDREDN